MIILPLLQFPVKFGTFQKRKKKNNHKHKHKTRKPQRKKTKKKVYKNFTCRKKLPTGSAFLVPVFRECATGLASNAGMSIVHVKQLMVLLDQTVGAECRATCSTILSFEAVLSPVVIKACSSVVECLEARETKVDRTLVWNRIVAGTASHVSSFLTLCLSLLSAECVKPKQSESIYKDREANTQIV